MTRSLIAGLGMSLALAGPAAAAGSDGVFGDLLSRSAGTPTAGLSRDRGEAGLREREREARNLRREYWERERGRLITNTSNGTVVATR